MGLVTGGGVELRERHCSVNEIRSANVGAGEVGVDECGAGQVGMVEALAGKIAAGQVVVRKVYPTQIMSLVAGRRVKLRERQSGPGEIRAPHLGGCEIGAGERSGEAKVREARIGK